MSDRGPSEISVNTVLERLSNHLDALAQEVCTLEHLICNDLKDPSVRRSGNIQQLQGLDFMRQSLEDTALLTLFLSRSSTGVLDARVALKLRLQATRDMLVHDAHPPSAQRNQDNVGEVDLF